MRLSDHDLLQLTEEELLELPDEVLRRLSVKLLYDLKEARERLRETSRNSSRPPRALTCRGTRLAATMKTSAPNKDKMNFLERMRTLWTPKKHRKPDLRKEPRTRRTKHSKPRSWKIRQGLESWQTTWGAWLRA